MPAEAAPRAPRSIGEERVLGRHGPLAVKLAHTAEELRQAQRLRYQVFYEEMSARADPLAALLRRDADRYDGVCDHLVVVDLDASPVAGGPAVVGTYRLLRQEVAERHFGFYSAREFDLSPLFAHRGRRILELGRSCVLRSHRDRRTLELLWRGIHAYVEAHGVDILMGCASLEGTDPIALGEPLGFLHHHARSPDGWRVRAHGPGSAFIDLPAKREIDPRRALRCLPPLIKGYLRLGATFGEGVVVDRQFGTTDVFVLLRAETIAHRYAAHFGRGAREVVSGGLPLERAGPAALPDSWESAARSRAPA
jgi:putative hemolysin